jgi:hypothetical protein
MCYCYLISDQNVPIYTKNHKQNDIQPRQCHFSCHCIYISKFEIFQIHKLLPNSNNSRLRTDTFSHKFFSTHNNVCILCCNRPPYYTKETRHEVIVQFWILLNDKKAMKSVLDNRISLGPPHLKQLFTFLQNFVSSITIRIWHCNDCTFDTQIIKTLQWFVSQYNKIINYLLEQVSFAVTIPYFQKQKHKHCDLWTVFAFHLNFVFTIVRWHFYSVLQVFLIRGLHIPTQFD